MCRAVPELKGPPSLTYSYATAPQVTFAGVSAIVGKALERALLGDPATSLDELGINLGLLCAARAAR